MRLASPWRREPQSVGILLVPFQAALRPVNTQHDVVLVTDGDLGRPEDPSRAVRVSQQDAGIVVEPATGSEGREIGQQGRRLDARHKGGEIVGVGADIADAAARARAGGIGAPGRTGVPLGFQRGCQPVLRIFCMEHAKLADFAGGHHRSHLPDHGIAGVIGG